MNKKLSLSLLYFIVLSTCISNTVCGQQTSSSAADVGTKFETLLIKTPPKELKLDSFYQKYTDAFGIPVVSSKNVSSNSLLIARDIINYMLLKRPDIRKVMIEKGARLSIIGQYEMQTDLPECRDWKKPALTDKRLTPKERENYNQPGGIASMSDRGYWDQRARGMGGIQTSCAEENLTGIPGTRYYGENIMVHEWSHNVMYCLETADPELFKQIDQAYKAALAKGMYKGQYASNTVAEYWAEGSQWWFWSNYEFYDGQTRVQSPEDLKSYDPSLYAILDKVYAGHHIPCDVYYGRNLKN